MKKIDPSEAHQYLDIQSGYSDLLPKAKSAYDELKNENAEYYTDLRNSSQNQEENEILGQSSDHYTFPRFSLQENAENNNKQVKVTKKKTGYKIKLSGQKRLHIKKCGYIGILTLSVGIVSLVICVTLYIRSQASHNILCDTDNSVPPTGQLLRVAADCYKNNSLEYRGAVNFTVSGRSCQYWNVQHPHIKLFSPFDEDERTTNYCRDFPNYIHGTPWCYTGDADFRFEFCPVVKCNTCLMSSLQLEGTTVSYNITYGVVAAVYTCQLFRPGISVPHCPISTCKDNEWSQFNMSCTYEDRYTNSSTYKGKVSCTVDGIPCKIWSTVQNILPVDAEDHNTNFCRDPDGKGQPWCFADTEEVRNIGNWEFCYVPKR